MPEGVDALTLNKAAADQAHTASAGRPISLAMLLGHSRIASMTYLNNSELEHSVCVVITAVYCNHYLYSCHGHRFKKCQF